MYLLSALAAGLVRRIHIDRLDKLSEGIGRQLRKGAVPFYPLNKLLYILCLLFLFMDLLLQTLDLGFEVFLFLGVVSAHHSKALIVQPSGYIVLINADEKAVKLSDSLLSLCQPLLIQPQRFLTLHTELLLHLRTEISLVASDYRYDLLNVLPDDLFQYNSTDIMSAALVLVGTMGGADEEVLPLFKIAGGGVVELLLAVVAEHQAGKHIALSRCRSAVPLLPNLLHLIKDFQRDDCRVGVIENLAILHWIFPLLLVPDGVGIGLEIDGAAGVLHVFEDVSNGAFVPAILILRSLMRCFSPLPLFIGGGVQHLFLFQQSGDLARPFSLHAECKNPPHHLCRFLVNHPFLRIVRVTLIAVGNVGGQALSTLSLCLVDGTDFAAGVFGIPLVEPVLDTCHVAIGAVGVNGVEVVVDGNIPHAVLRKRVVDIKPCQRGITPQSAEVFRNHHFHMTGFNFRKHLLKAGAPLYPSSMKNVGFGKC